MTKVLALLLLIVAGALVFMVYQQRRQKQEVAAVNVEPKPIAQRPDDKLGADEQATIDVFEKFSRSVVNVTSIHRTRDFQTRSIVDGDVGTGSGFVWDQSGHIITNFHVIEQGETASVTLSDGKTYPARIIGTAPDKDIAVLRIDAPAASLVPLPIGQSANLKVGQKVLAIGTPFGPLAGLDRTLTTGVISGLGREIKRENGRRPPITDVIQTDASINPGNSGGPLLDSAGRLIGINTAIYSPTGASAGIGFAVPVDTVNVIVPQLLRDGKIVRPGLGINILNDALAAQNGIDGVAILQVQQGGAADNAGLQGLQSVGGQTVLGDVIVALDGKEIHKSTDLFKALDPHKVGDSVDVTVKNQTGKRTVKVILQPVQ